MKLRKTVVRLLAALALAVSVTAAAAPSCATLADKPHTDPGGPVYYPPA
jgi:hypothetical protein